MARQAGSDRRPMQVFGPACDPSALPNRNPLIGILPHQAEPARAAVDLPREPRLQPVHGDLSPAWVTTRSPENQPRLIRQQHVSMQPKSQPTPQRRQHAEEKSRHRRLGKNRSTTVRPQGDEKSRFIMTRDPHTAPSPCIDTIGSTLHTAYAIRMRACAREPDRVVAARSVRRLVSCRPDGDGKDERRSQWNDWRDAGRFSPRTRVRGLECAAGRGPDHPGR